MRAKFMRLLVGAGFAIAALADLAADASAQIPGDTIKIGRRGSFTPGATKCG